ncbi:MAG: hypothetical protein AUI33_14350, partial [Ignavibacteria bacterium 13_1_40CM_2_61_4]
MAAALLWLLLAPLLPAGPADPPAPAAPESEAKLFFIQLSDPQFGMFEENRGFQGETVNLTRAVAHVNRLRPAFVVVTGDLVNRPGDEAQATEYLRLMRSVDRSIPVHSVAGNHDVENTPTPESLAWFRRTFGPDRGVFQHAGAWFLFLNSSLVCDPKKSGAEAEEQYRWLDSELYRASRSGARQIVLFQHHPWFVERADEPDSYHSVPLSARGRYLERLRQAGVRAVFAGHLHRCAEAADRDLAMVATGPVGKPLGKEPSGLRVVWVFEDRIVHRYYGLEEVPQ